MKSNVKTKLIIAVCFVVIIAALIAWFFISRSGDGQGMQSAYNFTTTRTTVTTTQKTTKKTDSKTTTKKGATTTTTKKNASKTTTKKSTGKKIVVPAQYASILNKYQDAINAKSNAATLKQQKLSPVLAACYGVNPDINLGFYVDDYNGDGVTDLLIGTTDKSQSYDFVILDYYTLKNGKAVRVFQSQSNKDYYCAVTNGRILEKATDGSSYSAWLLYEFNAKGTALKIKNGVISDKTANAKKPWFKTTDTDGDTSNDTAISTEAGQKRKKQLEDACTQLDFIQFSKYNRANKNTTTTVK